MHRSKHNITFLIGIICIAFLPLVGIAQESDTLIFCQYPDEDAQPPYRLNELLHIILDNQENEITDCVTPDGTFYYNITILEDGSVAILNLECVNNGRSCYLSVNDISKLEKWIPAVQNGKNCNQKMRLKTYIHLQ